jgi:pyrroline-5-carboxylate reductase
VTSARENDRIRLGVVGVGTIAALLVEAILTGPHADAVEVVLSPRSAHRASDLASRFDRVRVAADNQAVLEASDVVLLAVLPPQVTEVCDELSFRADHVVAGLAAGWPPSVLAPLVAPATTLCQLIPLPMVALRTGPLVMHPEVPVVERLLEDCGDLVLLEEEPQIIALSCASAIMSSYFELQRTVVDWLVSTGLPERTAYDYVTSQLLALGTEGRTTSAQDRFTLPVEHETPGGLNEQIRRALTETGTFETLTATLAQMHHARRMRVDT